MNLPDAFASLFVAPDSAGRYDPLLLTSALLIFLLVLLALLALVAVRQRAIARRCDDGEFRIRQLLENSQEGFAQIDRTQRLIEVNPAFCSMLNRPRDEVIGHRISEFLSFESAAAYGDEMARCAAGACATFELALQRPDDELRHCQVRSLPLRTRTGQRSGTGLLITDISGRIAHEAHMRQAVAVFDNTAEGIVLTDARARILSVNPAFTQITQYQEHEVLGRNPAIMKSGRHKAIFYQEMWGEINTTGFWQGEIWNRRKSGEIYPQWLNISTVRNAAGAVENYVGVFSDLSHIKRSAEEMERLAHFDPLTGLANRLLFGIQLKHALERAQRHGRQLAIMEIDLDGFKNVNDTLGHPAGDRLLQVIGSRLQELLRAEDIVARLGGDEFAVIIESASGADGVARIAQKIITALKLPVEVDVQQSFVSGSIGIALFPADGQDATALMKAADTALYVSKREGRNTYRFYAENMTRAVQLRHVLEQGLRQAIERNELELWYQPQIDLASGKVAGAEALVRWRHAEQGVISPADFLPVACETGLIIPLGEWVLRTACSQVQAWRQRGIDLEQIAVNVDGQQIVRSDFVETVGLVLAETGLPPAVLELEITEGFLLENAENGMGTAMRFAEMGVRIAIDDFGTGYSSLVYLKYLHANTLKIDKCFVGDLPGDDTSAAIIQAVVSLGHGLGFNLVAEGVETPEQRDYLKAAGCDLVQGYYFAKPMPAQEFEAWLQAYAPGSG